jgi:hypothetical protein
MSRHKNVRILLYSFTVTQQRHRDRLAPQMSHTQKHFAPLFLRIISRTGAGPIWRLAAPDTRHCYHLLIFMLPAHSKKYCRYCITYSAHTNVHCSGPQDLLAFLRDLASNVTSHVQRFMTWSAVCFCFCFCVLQAGFPFSPQLYCCDTISLRSLCILSHSLACTIGRFRWKGSQATQSRIRLISEFYAIDAKPSISSHAE